MTFTSVAGRQDKLKTGVRDQIHDETRAITPDIGLETRFVNTSLGKMAYVDTERGKETILFLHGLPTCKEIFYPIFQGLRARYRLVAADQINFGESERAAHFVSHFWRADLLNEFRLKLGLEKVHLVSHGFGSVVALAFAARYPDAVGKTVFLSPIVYPDYRHPWPIRLMRQPALGEALAAIAGSALIARAVRRGLVLRERFTPAWRRLLLAPYQGPGGREAILRNARWGPSMDVLSEHPSHARALRGPSLIVHGRQDPFVPEDQASRLHGDVAGSSYVVIEQAGHYLTLDAPEALREFLGKFFT